MTWYSLQSQLSNVLLITQKPVSENESSRTDRHLKPTTFLMVLPPKGGIAMTPRAPFWDDTLNLFNPTNETAVHEIQVTQELDLIVQLYGTLKLAHKLQEDVLL
jgi:hypothetical protein